MSDRFDVCVIGGGLAGLSAAAGLAAFMRVALVEREPHLAYHSTGRSAALFAESYGNAPVRALTRASRAFYAGGGETQRFTSPRGVLFVGTRDQEAALLALQAALADASPNARLVAAREAIRFCPALRAETLAGAILDPDARDIDVAAVVDHFARQLRSRDGVILRNTEVRSVHRSSGEWQIEAGSARIHARIVVNAAGAWADELARLADVAPVGLAPKLRTAVCVPAENWRAADWPCVIDASEQWYFRPTSGSLLLSPADETPSPPCDAQPDDHSVAVTIDRIEAATHIAVTRVIQSWAGLRTFAADRSPVAGFDRDAPGFFWLAGQGGYGIQTAPALAELAVALIAERPMPPSLIDAGVDPAALHPGRSFILQARPPA